jgi:hypothetical protein
MELGAEGAEDGEGEGVAFGGVGEVEVRCLRRKGGKRGHDSMAFAPGIQSG